jgi:hypothetical protein
VHTFAFPREGNVAAADAIGGIPARPGGGLNVAILLNTTTDKSQIMAAGKRAKKNDEANKRILSGRRSNTPSLGIKVLRS